MTDEHSTSGREQSEIEVSEHHIIDGRGKHTEYEVHTGLSEEYVITEALAQKVYAETGLDLWNGDYRSGCPIKILEESDETDALATTDND